MSSRIPGYNLLFRWWTGPWQHCSVTCGNGTRQRTVICIRSVGKDEQLAVGDEYCSSSVKPKDIDICDNVPTDCNNNHKAWETGKWSQVNTIILKIG